jgi:hypothetical protein
LSTYSGCQGNVNQKYGSNFQISLTFQNFLLRYSYPWAYLFKQCAIKMYGIVKIELHHPFTSAPDEAALSVSSPLPYHQGNRPWYPLYRRLGGLQGWSGHYGGEKNIYLLLPPVIKPQTQQSIAYLQHQLSYSSSLWQFWLFEIHLYSETYWFAG